MSTMTLQQAIEIGLEHHRAGRFKEAEQVYLQILQAQPKNPEVLHLMGVMGLQLGKLDMAVDFINRAIAENPRDGRYFSNLGQVLAAMGRLDDAIGAYQQSINLNPNLPECYNNLGNALQEKQQYEQAAMAYREALRIRNDFHEAHSNLGNALGKMGQTAAAVESYRKALAIRSDFPDAWSNLGNALLDLGQVDDAIAAHRRSVELRPDAPDLWNNFSQSLAKKGLLGDAIQVCQRALSLRRDFIPVYLNLSAILQENKQFDEAIAVCQAALSIKPELPQAYNNMGNALRGKGDHEQAITAYRNAVALQSDYADAHANLGRILQSLGRSEQAVEACRRAIAAMPNHADAYSDLATALIHSGRLNDGIAAYRQAAALKPGSPLIHYNLGMALLLNGDYRHGWPECEWRWQVKEHDNAPPQFAQPKWDGTNLNGKTVLLWAEQGFGDCLQFARFAPLVARQGGRVLLASHPPTLPLLKSLQHVEVVSLDEPLPPHDMQYALMSLPLVFDTTVQSIPAGSYLRADPELVNEWKEKMGEEDGRLKVGLAWSGRPTHANDHNRSIQAQILEPLGKLSNVKFFSLQIPRSEEPPIEMTDLMADAQNFADTAAFIENLDLVITVDTSVAHVAGAMGKPVWVLLAYVPDWRWLMDRNDSPWYPTARLFRQPAPSDWATVIDEVAKALREASSANNH
ncbi:MAG TPA: tetratricopeptide repeat protein [Tepidisphaeraceae bacterium]|nr:tetratricopeptide repeat protein [Tepidisphaeraceae bacterium]